MREFVLVTLGGEFVKIKLPSWDEILAQTSPRQVTLLLQQTGSSQAALTVSQVTAAAQHHAVESRHFSLHRKEGYEELLDGLPEMATSDCWAIVEHCHMLVNCHDMLTELTKVR